MIIEQVALLEYHCFVMHTDGPITHREKNTSERRWREHMHQHLIELADCIHRLRDGNELALLVDLEFNWEFDPALRLRWQQVHPLSALASFELDQKLATTAVCVMAADEALDDRKALNAAANLLACNGLTWNETLRSSLFEVAERPAIVAIP